METRDTGHKVADRIEDNLEDAFEGGLPKLGRSIRRGAIKLARRAMRRGTHAEEIIEPGRVARRIVGEAVSRAYAIDTKGDELTAPDYYYVVVPWVSYEHLYKPHLEEITRNIERDVADKLGSDRYLIRIDPHVAIAEGGQLPDDKFEVTVCYSKRDWDALRGEQGTDATKKPSSPKGDPADPADGIRTVKLPDLDTPVAHGDLNGDVPPTEYMPSPRKR